MAISTFGELKAALAAWADNSIISDRLPDFIRQAHEYIKQELVLVDDLTIDSGTVILPDGFGRVVSIAVEAYPRRFLSQGTTDQLTDLGTGIPAYYRVEANADDATELDLILSPAPDTTYLGKLMWKFGGDFFATNDDTNAVLTRHPFAYLYAGLVALANYAHDTDVLQRAMALRDGEFNSIMRKNTSDATDGSLQMTPSAFVV